MTQTNKRKENHVTFLNLYIDYDCRSSGLSSSSVTARWAGTAACGSEMIKIENESRKSNCFHTLCGMFVMSVCECYLKINQDFTKKLCSSAVLFMFGYND